MPLDTEILGENQWMLHVSESLRPVVSGMVEVLWIRVKVTMFVATGECVFIHLLSLISYFIYTSLFEATIQPARNDKS